MWTKRLINNPIFFLDMGRSMIALFILAFISIFASFCTGVTGCWRRSPGNITATAILMLLACKWNTNNYLSIKSRSALRIHYITIEILPCATHCLASIIKIITSMQMFWLWWFFNIAILTLAVMHHLSKDITNCNMYYKLMCLIQKFKLHKMKVSFVLKSKFVLLMFVIL